MTNAIRVHRPGGPEEMRWEEVAVGEPSVGQVRIAQRAAGLNYIDIYHRTGAYPLPTPFTPGVEGAGVVEAIGEGVSGLKVGDRVAYAGPIGGYAEVRLIEHIRFEKCGLRGPPADVEPGLVVVEDARARWCAEYFCDLVLGRAAGMDLGDLVRIGQVAALFDRRRAARDRGGSKNRGGKHKRSSR